MDTAKQLITRWKTEYDFKTYLTAAGSLAVTLQNTLIMVTSGGADPGMLPLTAITSAFIWIAALLLSFFAIIKGVRRVLNEREK